MSKHFVCSVCEHRQQSTLSVPANIMPPWKKKTIRTFLVDLQMKQMDLPTLFEGCKQPISLIQPISITHLAVFGLISITQPDVLCNFAPLIQPAGHLLTHFSWLSCVSSCELSAVEIATRKQPNFFDLCNRVSHCCFLDYNVVCSWITTQTEDYSVQPTSLNTRRCNQSKWALTC